MRTNFIATLRVSVSMLAIVGTGAPAFADTSEANSQLFHRLDANDNGAISASEVPASHKSLFARLVRNGDADGNRALSQAEFMAAITPKRPDKKIEDKQSGGYPQADAVRFLLLTMDTSRDGWIKPEEVPSDMQSSFDDMADRIDANKNGTLDQYELSRGARQLGQIAARYVARERIDLTAELKKLTRSQGEQANRFDEPPGALLAELGKPGQAKLIFARFDANSDGKLLLAEFPEPFQPQLGRLVRVADRDRDGGLSEREFVAAAERVGRAQGMRPKSALTSDDKSERKARRQMKMDIEEDANEASMAAPDAAAE